MSHVTHRRNYATHMWMGRVTYIIHVDESCRTHECLSHTCHACEWVRSIQVMSHIWIRHVTHMDQSCHACRWVLSHTSMSCHTHTREWCRTCQWYHKYNICTVLPRSTGCLKLHVSFCKRATDFRALLQTPPTHKEKGSYASSSPCIIHVNKWGMYQSQKSH